ncbi:MAG: T9SS type A sorting domain-containing protein, partial [Bacteroidota bacterium]
TIYDGSAIAFSPGSIIAGSIPNAVIPANSTRYITIGSASALTPLPVDLTAFNANVTGNNSVTVSWQTGNEINNDYFTVQKSLDGIAWQDLMRIKTAAGPLPLHSYNIIDQNPYMGISWYRLQQTDLDGRFKYSAVRVVMIDKTERNSIVVYPNPVSNLLTVKGSSAELKTVKIYTLTGQDVTLTAKTIASSSTARVLDIAGLAPGVYNIKTSTGSAKIIKQ